MKHLNRTVIAAAAALLSAGAFCATQGTLSGTSSTGSFSNTFDGTAPRQVQVLNLSDTVMTPNAPLLDVGNIQLPGVSDKFCVVDTSGGAVRLTFSNANGFSENDMPLAKAAGGEAVAYVVQFASVAVPSNALSFGTSQTSFVIPGTSVATAAGSCGTGNVTKSIWAYSVDGTLLTGNRFPVNNKVYADTITIVLTPE